MIADIIVCYGTITGYITYEAWGNIYSGSLNCDVAFAKAFSNTPSLILNNTTTSGNGWIMGTVYNTNKITNITFGRPTIANQNYSVSYVAIGK